MGEGKNLVGVDIGSSSIKVCQVKETRKGPVLQRVGYAALPPQTIVDGQVMDPATVVDTLKRVFSEAKMTAQEITRGLISSLLEQSSLVDAQWQQRQLGPW